MNAGEEARLSRLLCLLATFLLLVAFCGCSVFRRPHRAALSGSIYAGIYDRADAEFATAMLVKPAESSQTNLEVFQFAPLIMQEIAGEGQGNGRDRFGQVAASQGIAASGKTNATIYFHKAKVLIQDRLHDELAYFWHCVAPVRDSADRACSIQGVRITLDSAGRPVIWEVLSDSTGADIFVVPQSLEAAAAAEFGKALPGRRFSVERGLRDAPKAIVARVIDDGPVPMGPILYLRAGTMDISTVICRCMPAQAKRLAGESCYELVTVQDCPSGSHDERALGRDREQTASDPDETVFQRHLEHCLRLPGSF